MSGLIISEVVPGLPDVFFFLFVHTGTNVGGCRSMGRSGTGLNCGGGHGTSCLCMHGWARCISPQGIDDYLHVYISDPHHFLEAGYMITVRLIQSRYDWNGMVCRFTCLRWTDCPTGKGFPYSSHEPLHQRFE